MEIHDSLKESKEIRNDIPIVMEDDAQITTTVSKKRKNEKPFYTVLIEKDDDFSE